jgi:hypothetical protein
LAACTLALILISLHTLTQPARDQGKLTRLGRMVEDLALTDLCLFTEARYTRHLSQADLHSPFQDHPLSFEHFPSGSFVLPPQRVRPPHANLD